MKQIKQIVAINVFLAATKCTKFVEPWTPLRELTTLPQAPYSVGEGDTPPHSPPPRRLRRLDSHAFSVCLGAFGASLPAFRHFFFTV